MFKETFSELIYELWPMIFIFSIIISSIRITYLIKKKKKFIFYREFLGLLFIIYILTLFHVVTFQDTNYGTSNFTPFTEMFRYSFGSRLFIKNIVGNLLLFIPFGLFVSYYLKLKSIYPVLFLSLISSLSIEITQYKIGRVFDVDDIILNIFGAIIGFMIYIAIDSISKKLPKIFRNEWFISAVLLFVITIVLLYLLNLDKIIIGMLL